MIDVTVVIPTRNRARMLSDLLDSLRAQKSGGMLWETLVIDNGSTDGTPEMLKSKGADFPVPLRYIYEPNPGLHICRNLGATEASGKVVAFLDDDMVVDENWIQGARLVLESQAPLVGGRILPLWESPPPKWLEALFPDSLDKKVLGFLGLIDLGTKVEAISANYVFGGNCFVRREVIFELRGYHPDSLPQELIRYRGDGETGFALKFTQHKLISLYNPVALVYHCINAERMTFDYFCNRAYKQGVSDSFTRIRREHNLLAELVKAPEHCQGILRRILGSAGLPILAINKMKRHLLPNSRAAERIQKQGRSSYKEGFAFHQKEVKNDRKLLEWVLRKDYMGKNGELPV